MAEPEKEEEVVPTPKPVVKPMSIAHFACGLQLDDEDEL